jgi:hypothetical protein
LAYPLISREKSAQIPRIGSPTGERADPHSIPTRSITAHGTSEKLLALRKAEAEAETEALQRQGIAKQRKAIIGRIQIPSSTSTTSEARPRRK